MKKTILGLLFALGLSCHNTFAQSSATGNMTANASLNSTCTITGGSINFGSIQMGAGNTTGSGMITLLCSGGISYDLSFSAGNSGNELQRTMAGQSSGDALNYNLYTDTTYTTIIGDGQSGTSHPLNNYLNGRAGINGTNSGRNAYISTGRTIQWYAYGSLSNTQYVTPDTYTDNIVVTVTY